MRERGKVETRLDARAQGPRRVSRARQIDLLRRDDGDVHLLHENSPAEGGEDGHEEAAAETSESTESESIRHFLTLYRVSKTLFDTIWSV